MTEFILYLIIIDVILGGIMMISNSFEMYDCWNVPDESEIAFYILFAFIMFPFWLLRQILLILSRGKK